MIPALALIGIGRKRKFALPLPVILLWPVIFLALAVLGLASLFVRRGTEEHKYLGMAKTGLLSLFQLSGLRIDVASRDRDQVFIWLI